jgi:hypothetical protein
VAWGETELINTTFRYNDTFYAMHTSEQKTNRIVAQVIRDLRYAMRRPRPRGGWPD